MSLKQMMELQKNFTANDKTLADYILTHNDEVLGLSAKELGRASYTSSAAVIRFCHTLGLEGYNEFKIKYARELEQNLQVQKEVNPNFPFRMNDTSAEIAIQLRSLVTSSITQTQNSLLNDKPDLEKAVALLTSAGKVGIFGAGDAYIAGLAFQAQMMRAGFNYLTTPVYGEQGHLAQTFHAGDTALILSYSGTTPRILDIAARLSKLQTSIIAITSNRESILVRLADVTIFLPDAEEKFHRLGNFSSQASMTYVLNVLYSLIYVRTCRNEMKMID